MIIQFTGKYISPKLRDFKNNLYFKISICLLLGLFLYFLFLKISRFSDTAYFGGDTWEYQSMAVNFAKGHGIQKFGGIEKFDTYRFDTNDTINPNYSAFVKTQGYFNTYRTPGYSFFLGVVYKIVGVKPLLVKKIQLILIILIGVSLPILGWYVWNKIGFIAGLISAPIYVYSDYKFATHLLTESLTCFLSFLIIVFTILFFTKRKLIYCFFIGIISGFTLLIKANFVFFPLLLCFILFIRFIQQKQFIRIREIIFIIFPLVIVVLPWSLYASAKTNRIIILSDQGGAVLLGSHNEFCRSGVWNTQYRDDPSSFYNTDGLENQPAMNRVINFYSNHPKLILINALNKIIAGFFVFPFLLLVLFLFTKEIIDFWLEHFFTSSIFRKIYWFAALILIPLFIFLSFKIVSEINYFQPFMNNNKYILFAFSVFLVFLFYKMQRKCILSNIPSAFIIMFINFLLVTVIFIVDNAVYPSRYVKVIDYIFILSGVYYTIEYFLLVLKKIRK